MNKDHRIWRTYDDVWIRVVGQQVSKVGHVRPRQQGHAADHSKSTRTCGRPCQQTTTRTCGRPRTRTCGSARHVADHVSKYTWHNQMMTSVKRKLARAMSTSDVSKLRHSGRITSGVSPPRNVKSPKSRRTKFRSHSQSSI
jgi:hypothetical protein